MERPKITIVSSELFGKPVQWRRLAEEEAEPSDHHFHYNEQSTLKTRTGKSTEPLTSVFVTVLLPPSSHTSTLLLSSW